MWQNKHACSQKNARVAKETCVWQKEMPLAKEHMRSKRKRVWQNACAAICWGYPVQSPGEDSKWAKIEVIKLNILAYLDKECFKLLKTRVR